MEKLQTLKDFESHWQILLQAHNCQSNTSPTEDTAAADADDEDPFDCGSLAVPPTPVLVDSVANEFVERWRELDQRKISAGAVATNEDEREDEEHGVAEPAAKRTKTSTATPLPRWYEKHVRLPEQFDYATLASAPPEDDGTGDRVVSLTDPEATSSYHTELWKLFSEIPKQPQLEEDATFGVDLPATKTLHDEIDEAGKTSDGHALSRLRMNDRHDAPPAAPPARQQFQSLRGTLRFECLRQQMRRGSTPDSSRMVFEFLGSHTLLDVHEALVELTDDELWRQKNAVAAPPADAVSGTAAEPQSSSSSGYFFIEGTFYTTGSVDYTKPILDWLKSGKERDQTRRLAHLGITPGSVPEIKSMAETRLEDLPCRLGFRYVHVHHGDVECSIFCTDRRLISKVTAETAHFPILHDTWTPSYNTPDCEVCQNRSAAVATSTTCSTLGHRALCEACCRELKLPPEELKRYSLWRGQADISAAAAGEKTF